MRADNDRKIKVGALTAALLIPLLTGVFSAFLTASDMDLYETMNRPALAPPGWLFPIAWTVLYILMGLASYIVLTSSEDQDKKRRALTVYAAQLIMNFFWCTIFFTYRLYLVSFIWLLMMWILVIICAVMFFRIRRKAGLMMLPLALWTTFAAYLNLATYIMSVTAKPL